MTITLPHLGKRTITEDPKQPGHYLWLDSFGWHDCSITEDKFIKG
jgi:hypothetical protein